MTVMPSQPNKVRWGELEDDDGEDLNFLLPPKQVIGPDENGIKKVIEYKFNDEVNKVKITRIIRIRKLAQASLNVRAVERRSWSKFGDALREDVGSRLTMMSTEDIVLERPGTKQEETKATEASLSQNTGGGAALKLCRACGKKGDHWTAACPYRDLAQPSDTFVDKPPTESTATSGCTYVPPSKRRDGGDNAGFHIRRRNDENSLRVTNLSDDTRDEDLRELFRPFGQVSRAQVVMDKKTGISRGFGYVNFVSREEAERAINKLNGYGYDNLILKVEWAAPRPN